MQHWIWIQFPCSVSYVGSQGIQTRPEKKNFRWPAVNWTKQGFQMALSPASTQCSLNCYDVMSTRRGIHLIQTNHVFSIQENHKWIPFKHSPICHFSAKASTTPKSHHCISQCYVWAIQTDCRNYILHIEIFCLPSKMSENLWLNMTVSLFLCPNEMKCTLLIVMHFVFLCLCICKMLECCYLLSCGAFCGL